jgi:hypothetical protein
MLITFIINYTPVRVLRPKADIDMVTSSSYNHQYGNSQLLVAYDPYDIWVAILVRAMPAGIDSTYW